MFEIIMQKFFDPGKPAVLIGSALVLAILLTVAFNSFKRRKKKQLGISLAMIPLLMFGAPVVLDNVVGGAGNVFTSGDADGEGGIADVIGAKIVDAALEQLDSPYTLEDVKDIELNAVQRDFIPFAKQVAAENDEYEFGDVITMLCDYISAATDVSYADSEELARKMLLDGNANFTITGETLIDLGELNESGDGQVITLDDFMDILGQSAGTLSEELDIDIPSADEILNDDTNLMDIIPDTYDFIKSFMSDEGDDLGLIFIAPPTNS